jgi:hypothetical protein
MQYQIIECYSDLFGLFRLVDGGIAQKAYETIMQVIKDKTEDNESIVVDYYEAARIAYKNGYYMRKHIDAEIKDVDREINKTFKPIWEFTYKISGGEEAQIKLVKRDPDNLLVSWIPGGRIYCE